MLSASKHAQGQRKGVYFYVGSFMIAGIILLVYFYDKVSFDKLNVEITMLKSNLRSLETQLPNIYLYQKSPPLLPSIPTTAEEEKRIGNRGIYGGKGDKAHLGGFTERDWKGQSPALWDFMLGPLAVKSLIDVGCGRGFSTDYFLKRGARVLCVEGSHDAVTQSLLPMNVIREHDFSRGPWWPEETYDVTWSVEFVEHVGRQYMPNYFPVFRKSAILMITASAWGGHHHVEIHNQKWWWHGRFIAAGFVHVPELEDMVHSIVRSNYTKPGLRFPGWDLGQILGDIMIFINPSVAALPQHHHLFGGNGCFNDVINNADGGIPCEGVDKLPESYNSLLDCYRHQLYEKDVNNLERLFLTCKKHVQK